MVKLSGESFVDPLGIMQRACKQSLSAQSKQDLIVPAEIASRPRKPFYLLQLEAALKEWDSSQSSSLTTSKRVPLKDGTTCSFGGTLALSPENFLL
ncbi:hypothetical protein V6N13_036113 [Hibiscus sabdariffa]